jgi:hypothetical protein
VKRAWVKVAQPNKWKLRAVVNWESINGQVPRGKILHHKDRDTINDDPSNLEPKSRADHLAEHRHEFKAKALVSFIKARRRTRWSTKTKTPGKITGRHPANCSCPIHQN